MPEDLMVAVVTAVVTALLGAGTAWLALGAKIRSELEAEYDKDLRERRLKAYRTLWALTEPLARYSPPEALTAQGARSLSESLRQWYFRDGIVLSAAARDAYFALQGKLTAEPAEPAPPPTEPLGAAALKELQDASSRMRTALSRDVASRSPPMIASDNRER